ncbi:hypothetical protein B0F90DRAFT_1005618 [Multifurca ochricompacta]|uniref:Protein kinase domain-containing protein n=1 Tax=Multifurca ochricompacta TaxID=376703 RepID=A0AAD4M238_9AGAM|nr:hypothetical protein B0F90DRAFT_1005618 [Multifurca ochricompacta]
MEPFLSGRFVKDAPSTVTKSDEACTVQKEFIERIANDRPDMDAHLPPISLAYKGFGRFRAHMDSQNDHLMGRMPKSKAKFEAAIDEFLREMSRFYDSEMNRAESVRESLNEIWRFYFQEYEPRKFPVYRRRLSSSSDDDAVGPPNLVEALIKVKNELGTTDRDGSVELAAYYTQFLESNTSQESRQRFLFPALGILVLGAHIGFYALSFTKVTRLVALTPLLPAAIWSGDEWARPTLMKAFQAACILQYHINKDTAEFMADRLPHPPKGDLPYVNEVPAHPPSGKLHFETRVEYYQGKDHHLNRFIYGATLGKNKDRVVVKFTKRYCLPLHLFCAEKRHAPRVLGYGVVHGGWHVIVMEWIANDPSDRENYASKYLPRWSKDLKKLVDGFHEEGFVHGDLRDANLIVPKKNPKRIMLLNFDWGGDVKSGAVHYPAACRNSDLVDGYDLEITVMRDNLALDNTLRKLEAERMEIDED